MHRPKSLKFNMILNALRSVMIILVPLITFPYISKILGVENLGKVNFSISIISYFLLLASLGINTYAIREGARIRDDKEKFNKFCNEIFSINIISTILSYIILIFCLFSIGYLNDYKTLIMVLSIQIIFKTIGIEWLYSIYEDFLYITLRSLAFQMLALILLFIIVKKESDYIAYAVIIVISSVGSNILNYTHARKYIKIRFTWRQNINKHIRPIMVLFITSITVTIYVSSDMTILGFISGDYHVGIYSVSSKVYAIIKMILSSILLVSIPRVSNLIGANNLIEAKNTTVKIYKTLLTFLVPSIFILIILSKEIILIISDKTYIEANESLKILSFALFFCLGAWFWSQVILIPFKKEKIIFYATLISALLNVVLNFLFIPKWNANAAALTTIN